MKHVSITLASVVLALSAQAQESGTATRQDQVFTTQLARFVAHPHHCAQMLGGSDEGDTLPASYTVALDASLDEIGHKAAAQAVAEINLRCAQRLGELKFSSR